MARDYSRILVTGGAGFIGSHLARALTMNASSQLDDHDIGIILSRKEKTNRALWEVGYMLENMFLQARSLNISYASKIFEINEIKLMYMSSNKWRVIA